MKPWVNRPSLWLIDFGVTREARKLDERDYAKISAFYDKTNKERFEMLPEWVRANLGPAK